MAAAAGGREEKGAGVSSGVDSMWKDEHPD